MSSKLVCNFDTNVLSIVPYATDNYSVEDTSSFVSIPDNQDTFYVMQINGICLSDNEFVITTENKYYSALGDYASSVEISNENIETNESRFDLNEYIIQKTSHFLESELLQFCLYKITRA